MKDRRLIFAISVLLMATIYFGYMYFGSISSRTDDSILDTVKSVYSIDSKDKKTGRGNQYTVLKYEDIKKYYDDITNTGEGRNEEVEKHVNKIISEIETYEKKKIDGKYLLDFNSGEYEYRVSENKDNSIILIHFKGDDSIYVVDTVY